MSYSANQVSRCPHVFLSGDSRLRMMVSVLSQDCQCQLHVHIGISADSFIDQSDEGVQLLSVEELAVQGSADAIEGSFFAREWHGRSGQVTKLDSEGSDDCIDDGSFEGESPGDDHHDESKQLGEQWGDELSQDDGSKHHHEDWDEVSQLAEVEAAVLLSGSITSLVVTSVVI